MIDWDLSDFELFCEHLPDISSFDGFEDVAFMHVGGSCWPGLFVLPSPTLLCYLLVYVGSTLSVGFMRSEANLGSVIRYVIGCHDLDCPGKWEAWPGTLRVC